VTEGGRGRNITAAYPTRRAEGDAANCGILNQQDNERRTAAGVISPLW